ncbi:helix-turn-helix transcriptional regulator [Comamonas terrigena]|uniref:helix-turn-helix transcriptional regulator n=2 Tax=Comamonas terrigena TaxID=32013 RepID=UPI0035E3E27A
MSLRSPAPAPSTSNQIDQGQSTTLSAPSSAVQARPAGMHAANASAPKAVIRLSKLTQLLSVSRSTVYLRINPRSKYYDPRFPKALRLGSKAVGWLLADVHDYIDHLHKCGTESTKGY